MSNPELSDEEAQHIADEVNSLAHWPDKQRKTFTIHWPSLSDAQKNEAIACRVAGYDDVYEGSLMRHTKWGHKPDGPCPDYLRDANAVLSLLYPHHPWRADCGGEYGYHVSVMRLDGAIGPFYVTGEAVTFNEAALIALLRAKGVAVTT